MDVRHAGATASAADKGLLRLLTCGSVDDGKSTLIGRLLYDSKLVPDDQLSVLETDSRKRGATGEDADFALLVDALEAERQQGITIDVAYRYFSTPRRSFIVADTPGHEQYTRNMATGASNSDLAVVLVDARKGVLTQTKRHSCICSLLGIRRIVLAVNKIDLVEFRRDVFERIVDDYTAFATRLGFTSMVPIPISARFGDNVAAKSGNTPWYCGPALVEQLESEPVDLERAEKPFRLPVQWVNRPNLDFRGFSGTVASGRIGRGDPVTVAASGQSSRIARLVTADGDMDSAVAGDAVTVVLGHEFDIARGDMLVSPQMRPSVADQFAAHLIWMSQDPLLPGRSYLMRIGTRWLVASVTSLRHKVDVNTLEHIAGRTLELNEIGHCHVSASAPVAFDPYAENRETGSFILVDRFTNETAAAGMIEYALWRASNIHPEELAVTKDVRAALKHQKAAILWFTGLSGSGKSTLSKLLDRELTMSGYHSYVLDGDNLRHGLNKDLGFMEADRVENIRRVGEVAKLFADAGVIVLCSLISPFRAEREMIRSSVPPGEFVEIFVDTPLEECMRRDPKGLYGKARAGLIRNFTGVDSPYEPPTAPELHVTTVGRAAEDIVREILNELRKREVIR